MQGFIKLTWSEREIYINVDHIIMYYNLKEGSIIFLSHEVDGGNKFIMVNEAMEYINNLIESSPID